MEILGVKEKLMPKTCPRKVSMNSTVFTHSRTCVGLF